MKKKSMKSISIVGIMLTVLSAFTAMIIPQTTERELILNGTMTHDVDEVTCKPTVVTIKTCHDTPDNGALSDTTLYFEESEEGGTTKNDTV